MIYKSSTVPRFRRSTTVSSRVSLLVLISSVPLLLSLSGCTSSLTQLPSQKFETHSLDPFVQRQLSVGADSAKDTAISASPAARATEPKSATSVASHVAPGSSEELATGQSTTHEFTRASEGYIEEAAEERRDRELLNINAVNAPLDALLHALATESQLQLQSVISVDARVTLRMERQKLATLLDSLAEQAGFSWELSGKVLKIRNGESYVYSYPVNYLNIDRSTGSSVGLATQVGTINASVSGGDSIANSSQTRIENISEHRFWESLQNDVQTLLEQIASSPGSELTKGSSFTINREAGLLNLYAPPAVHQSVQRYLEQLHDSASRQVLIEATVVEVSLSDSFEAGVDWQVLAKGVNGISAVQSLLGAPLVNTESVGRVVAPSGLVSMVQQGSQADVGATLSLLEQFGDVRILSRPRIIALNNQSSVLKVVDNRVYFTVNIERSQSETRDEMVTETEIHTVPVGLVMNVTPQISGSGMVMLNVRPTLSRILGFVNDPNPELAEANVRNGVPEIQVREMESMLQVPSGNMAIIGGLMQETSEQDDSRIPGLGSVPFMRHLFSQRSQQRRQTELLIVLRPTVIEPHSSRLALR